MRHIQLTQRDLDIFRWVNSFRYVRANHIFRNFHVTQNFYRRLKLLVENEFLLHESIFRGLPGHYRCTKNAADVAQDVLLAPPRIDLHTYKHDMLVVDLALEMQHRTGGKWLTERRLRSTTNEDGLRKFSRQCPDGLLLVQNGTRTAKIAVELEHLNRKSRKRLGGIIENYLDGFSTVGRVDQVAYFCCSETIHKKVSEVVKHLGAGRLVEVRLLNDILTEGSEKEHGAKTERYR